MNQYYKGFPPKYIKNYGVKNGHKNKFVKKWKKV
jgi:hypothetical protein